MRLMSSVTGTIYRPAGGAVNSRCFCPRVRRVPNTDLLQLSHVLQNCGCIEATLADERRYVSCDLTMATQPRFKSQNREESNWIMCINSGHVMPSHSSCKPW